MVDACTSEMRGSGYMAPFLGNLNRRTGKCAGPRGSESHPPEEGRYHARPRSRRRKWSKNRDMALWVTDACTSEMRGPAIWHNFWEPEPPEREVRRTRRWRESASRICPIQRPPRSRRRKWSKNGDMGLLVVNACTSEMRRPVLFLRPVVCRK